MKIGSVLVTRPGEWHEACSHRIKPCKLYWTQIDAECLKDPLVIAALAGMQRVMAGPAQSLSLHLDAVLGELCNPRHDSKAMIESHCRLLLLELSRHKSDPLGRRTHS